MVIAVFKIKMEYIITLNGKRVAKGRSKTFTVNFARAMAILFVRGDVQVSQIVTDVTGAVRTIANQAGSYTFLNPIGSLANKIRLHIGSSSEPFSRTQYEMLSKIVEFDYSTYEITDTGTLMRVSFGGSWTNNTATAVTVREIGFSVVYKDSGGTDRRILLARDVLDTPIDVPTNGVLGLGYIITIPW